jgi:hypothetical protein
MVIFNQHEVFQKSKSPSKNKGIRSNVLFHTRNIRKKESEESEDPVILGLLKEFRETTKKFDSLIHPNS